MEHDNDSVKSFHLRHSREACEQPEGPDSKWMGHDNDLVKSFHPRHSREACDLPEGPESKWMGHDNINNGGNKHNSYSLKAFFGRKNLFLLYF